MLRLAYRPTGSVDFLANAARLRELQFVQDGESLSPEIARLVRAAASFTVIAEVIKNRRLGTSATSVTRQLEGPMVVLCSLSKVAREVAEIADAVPCAGFSYAISNAAVQNQRIPAAFEGELMMSLMGVQPADQIEGACLVTSMTRGARQAQSLLSLNQRLLSAPFMVEDHAELRMDGRLADRVTELLVQPESLSQMSSAGAQRSARKPNAA